MYNKEKSCPGCGWTEKYDQKSDREKINGYKYCPVCGVRLVEEDYSPRI